MTDIINWKALSRVLAENEGSIRSNRIPKKYEAKIQELNDLIEYWKKRHGVD